MPTTLAFTGELTVTSCWCGISVAIPSQLYAEAQRRHTSIYCPVGHTFVYSNTETDRLKAEVERLQNTVARKDSEVASAIASARAARGNVTKLKNRIANGVCPHCTRHFANLQRHIATKHGTEAKGDAKGGTDAA